HTSLCESIHFVHEVQPLRNRSVSALFAFRHATVVIARAAMSVSFPAPFTLVGATNPCPCGRAGEPGRKCSCTPSEVTGYTARMSGPLTDRIDMHVPVGAVALRELSSDASTGHGSADMRDRVARARCTQRARYRALRGVTCNAHVPGRWLDRNTPIDADARTLLHSAAAALELSARAYHRVIKVARTIADLECEDRIAAMHVAEGLRYRPVVRK
ncbi:MAG: ATP-binding protein, partial [Gemmatimonadota bacterium]|nr:ATP-binding protein [Gemmatimonadota bacterium]